MVLWRCLNYCHRNQVSCNSAQWYTLLTQTIFRKVEYSALYRMRRRRHSEVWSRPGSDTTRRTSLARRPRPGVLRAGSDSSSVSERPRTTVPVGLLRPGRQCWHSAASAFRQPSTTCSASLPAQHLRPSGLFICRPHSLELSPRFYPEPDRQCRLF